MNKIEYLDYSGKKHLVEICKEMYQNGNLLLQAVEEVNGTTYKVFLTLSVDDKLPENVAFINNDGCDHNLKRELWNIGAIVKETKYMCGLNKAYKFSDKFISNLKEANIDENMLKEMITVPHKKLHQKDSLGMQITGYYHEYDIKSTYSRIKERYGIK